MRNKLKKSKKYKNTGIEIKCRNCEFCTDDGKGCDLMESSTKYVFNTEHCAFKPTIKSLNRSIISLQRKRAKLQREKDDAYWKIRREYFDAFLDAKKELTKQHRQEIEAYKEKMVPSFKLWCNISKNLLLRFCYNIRIVFSILLFLFGPALVLLIASLLFISEHQLSISIAPIFFASLALYLLCLYPEKLDSPIEDNFINKKILPYLSKEVKLKEQSLI